MHSKRWLRGHGDAVLSAAQVTVYTADDRGSATNSKIWCFRIPELL